MQDWMVEEGALDPEVALVGEVGSTIRDVGPTPTGYRAEHNLAIFLRPLVINNARKLFGEAEIRVDALVLQAGKDSGSASLFAPGTFRFPRVKDGDDLANSENGLMIYYGRPKHFLFLMLTVARDTKDSDDLAKLIAKETKREDVSAALSQMAAAVTSPHVAAVQAALQAALTFGDIAYNLVRAASPSCLGLYRGNWLARRHNFGIGRHPSEGAFTQQDFSFAYEIVADVKDR